MTYRIATDRLVAFVEEQARLVEATPMPPDLVEVVPDDMPDDELPGVWLAAGLASQIGIALVDDPGRFVERVPIAAPAAVG